VGEVDSCFGGKPPSGADRDEALSKLKDLLSLYADIAPLFGKVGLAFEFTGYTNSPVSTVAEARKLIEDVAPGKIRLVIDTFHFHLGGGSVEGIRDLAPDEIAFVQVSDAADGAKDESDKLLPGEGVANLREVVAALKDIGYDGAYSVEVNGSKYEGVPAEEIAAKALQSVKALLEG
jgi:2-keto-myo-inositol isomerase